MQAMVRLLSLLLVLFAAQFAYAQDEEEVGEDGMPVGPTSTYFAIKPAFVVNYGGAGRLRYLKTAITLRVTTGGGSTGMMDVRHHLPYIRHSLVMLFSRQTNEDMSSMEGRELLRQAALDTVRKVLIEEQGEEFILDLLFDSFIIQR
jgi:flagellar protein FliL